MNKSKVYNASKVALLIALGLLLKSLSGNEDANLCWLPLALAGAGIASSLFGAKKSKAKAPPPPVDPLSMVPKSATGISDYYQNYVLGLQGLTKEQISQLSPYERSNMGLIGLNRSVMNALSPEQSAAVARGQSLAASAQNALNRFGSTAQQAMSQYGSKVGDYSTTLGDITGYTQVMTPEEEAQSLFDTSMAQKMAEEAFARRGVLSPEEQRMAEQQAREASAAAGRIGGNSAIASEIMNRENAMAARRAEAATLGQSAYTQGMGALQQRLQTQQARYAQLSAEQERELNRRQGLFAQNIGIGAQQAQERQLGFNQMMGIEQQRAALSDQAMRANVAAAGLAQDFYTTPGLNLFSLPLNFANQQAGAQNQYNKDVTATQNYNRQLQGQMFGSIGSTLLGAGLNGGMGTSLGNFGSFLGGGNMGNASTALGNVGLSALGQPMRAYTV